MAQTQSSEKLSELEYMFAAYYQTNFSRTVDKEYNALQQKQQKEFSERWSGAAAVSDPMQAYNHAMSGEWNRKGVDYMLTECNKLLFSNKSIAEDVECMKVAWRAVMLERLGQRDYERLSKGVPEGYADLADYYVDKRFEGLMMEQLARKQMPEGTADYILRKITSDNILGFAGSLGMKSPEGSGKLRDLAEKIYKPSTGEKVAAYGINFLIDGVSTGGYGTVAKAGTWLAVDGATRLFASSLTPKEFDEAFGEQAFGRKNFIEQLRDRSKKIPVHPSEEFLAINGILNRPLKTEYDNSRTVRDASQLKQLIPQEEGRTLVSSLERVFGGMGLPVKQTDYPKWMDKKSDTEKYDQACFWASLAKQMQESGIRVKKVGSTEYTQQEAAQKSYDWARSLAASQERQRAESVTYGQGITESDATQAQYQLQAERQAQAQQLQYQQLQQQQYQQQAPTPDMSGWGGFLDQMSLSGIGDAGRNIGHTLAMLPDLLVGMFTGKGNLRLKDNIWPLGLIVAGLFMNGKRHPLMKMLMLAFGGAAMLSRVSQAAMGTQADRQQPVRQMRRYADEVLDPRIQQPSMRGNTLLVTIDGVPRIITVNKEVVDAYEKGAIPLNTLANAVLQKIDVRQRAVEDSYVRREHEDQQAERTIAIK